MTGLVIMVCRNGIALSKACLKSVLAQTIPVNVLVVDNASVDGTSQYMAAQQVKDRRIYRMSFPGVQSVSRAWNLALHWAWERGYDEALVVNNDTELLSDTYRILMIARGPCGLITGVGVDRPPKVPPDVLNFSPHPDYSCYLITREAHQRVPFDEGYAGAYFEDCDHHVRLHRAGIKAGSIPLEFRHYRSSTLHHADQQEQDRINANYDLNKRRFLQQYGCLPWSTGYERLFEPGKGQEAGEDPEGQTG